MTHSQQLWQRLPPSSPPLFSKKVIHQLVKIKPFPGALAFKQMVM